MPLLKFISLFIVFSNCLADEGLYKTNDDVVILTGEYFQNAVLGTNTAWIIEFYNSWCGHCVHFAPTYKALATNIKGWQKVIIVAAVDCSKKHNVDLCREYNIPSYPSMVLFPPNASPEYRGEAIHDQDPASLRRRMIDFVENYNGNKPTTWPALHPLSSIEKIWDEAKDKHKHVILIFENKESYIGRQVILDFSNYEHVLIRRVTDEQSAKFGVRKLPAVFVVHGDGRYEHIAKGIKEREGITDVIKGIVNVGGEKEDEYVVTATPQTDTKIQPTSITNGTVVYMKDLESALSYSFRQEVAIHKNIEGEALQALKNFIGVLSKYFPAEEYLRKFLLRVKTWLDGISSGLTGEVWVYYIDSFQTVDTYLLDQINWVGCKGSEPKFRGYPCSMWTLFHTLTVNAYLAGKDRPKFLYGEVLNAVTDYMKYFFGCRVCSKHFLKMADSRQISSATDQVIWLWDAHNSANQRLHGDESEDPLHPKILFPSLEACPRCRTGSSDKGNNLSWDRNEVLNFLVKMYSKEHIVKNASIITPSNPKKSRSDLDWWEKMQRQQDLQKIQEIRQMKKQKLEDKLQKSGQKPPVAINVAINQYHLKQQYSPNSGMSSVDLNMCVFFYAFCLLIIGVLYYYFVKKKRMNPCNGCPNSKHGL